MHSKTRNFARMFIAVTALGPVFGGPIDWTSWKSQPNATTALGSLTVGATTVSVSYSGEIAFTQLNGTGFNYYTPLTTFTAPPTVPNAPPTSDIVAIDGTPTTHTITFGAAVVNPIMEIVSLGQLSLGQRQPNIDTQYIFSLAAGQSMAILAQGRSDAFGGCDTCLSLSGSTLTGTEGDGVVQFIGTYTSLTWTADNPEFWNGFTVGVTGLAIPEPANWGSIFLALTLGAALPLRRRKAKRSDEFDPHPVGRCGGKPSVACEQQGP